MPSRKRNKAKERKAKAAVAKGCSDDLIIGGSEWTKFLQEKGGATCTHGAPALVSDHTNTVTRYIKAFFERRRHKVAKEDVISLLASLFGDFRDVWGDEILRRTALDVLLSVGTNMLLCGEAVAGKDMARIVAQEMILVLEKYEGEFGTALINVASACADLRGGGDRELVRFYSRRIPCSCLKGLYSEAKKVQPKKTSDCHCCRQTKDRASMMVCGKCRRVQYCGRQCQVADWPKHKRLCAEFERFFESEAGEREDIWEHMKSCGSRA